MELRLTLEQQDMLEKNLPLVTHIAKKYFSKTDYVKNQDIIQEGILAMAKAIPKYDPTVAKFSTFMYPTISGHINRFANYQDRIIPIPHQKHLKEETIKKAELAKNSLSLDLKYKNKDGEDFTLLSIIQDEYTLEEDTVNRMVIRDAITSLNWKEKIIIIYRFYLNVNQTDIGKELSISQVHVHRLQHRALNEIKKFYLK